MAPATGHVHGNPNDNGFLKPVVFLHGGPSGGAVAKVNTSFFDPEAYRVVLFDQRGAGRSRPVAELRENTTQHLIEHVEKLRERIGVEKWAMVFGGSWGSTLALAYAQADPEAVGSLILRGIFLCSQEELDTFYRGTSSQTFYPEYCEEWLTYLPEQDRGDPLAGYYKALTSEDRQTRVEAGRTFNKLELLLSQTIAPDDVPAKLSNDEWGQLLAEENVQEIRHAPTTIVQGRLDLVCVPKVAWAFLEALPYSVAGAGHSAMEAATKAKLIEIYDKYGKLNLV
ncbi:hypothetical protein B0A48_15923 [Cryoendolithus antarcticus]|uniref:prolyl aminopeptidase n=1 Tax=Cryoendolithus antarcticus TaxID=1507870 RepID=A0A1V8SGX4_9PEZI|nr:hypothetical protein B0A48_15923 [Cryoendolithus antarcticus]